MIVADDLGRNDLGARNAHGTHGPRTITPAIDALLQSGVSLTSYHTFKICSPSRASTLTGRYPWGAGERATQPLYGRVLSSQPS